MANGRPLGLGDVELWLPDGIYKLPSKFSSMVFGLRFEAKGSRLADLCREGGCLFQPLSRGGGTILKFLGPPGVDGKASRIGAD